MRAFNLIPADERGGVGGGAGKSGGGAFVVLGLLGVLAIFALLYGEARHQISSQRGQVAALTIRTQQAQAQAARLAPYTSFMSLSEQRTQAVSQLVDSRFDWAHAFHELGRVLPRDAWISSLHGTIGSTTTTGAAPAAAAPTATAPAATGAGSSTTATASGAATGTAVASATPPGSVPAFTLSGCATSQTEVALTLDRLRLIDGVSEVTLQSSTKTSGGAGGGGAGAGGCANGDPAFAMQISFEPLPSTSGTSTTSTTVTASASTATGGGPINSTPAVQPTASTGGAR